MGRPALKLGSIYECRSKWRAALFIAISFAFLGPCYKKFCAFVNYLTLGRRKNVRVPIGKLNARRGDANARMDRGNRRRGRDACAVELNSYEWENSDAQGQFVCRLS
jgi:hypothetical protein